MTKKLLIGVGILAGAGLAYYLWKKNQPEEKSKATGISPSTKSRLGDILISTGKMKIGDKWLDTKDKQCCVATGSNTYKCKPAPCSISINA